MSGAFASNIRCKLDSDDVRIYEGDTYDEHKRYIVPLPLVNEDALDRDTFAPGNEAVVDGSRKVCSCSCPSAEEGCGMVRPHKAQLDPELLRL